MDIAFVVQIVDAVREIERQLAMANRLLMFTQPKRPGQITIHFRMIPKSSKGVPAVISGGDFGERLPSWSSLRMTW